MIFIEFWLLRRSALRADDVLRTFSLTLIIIGTLFFVTAGFDNNQIAPAMGLFGTIAGYLLGRRRAWKSRHLVSRRHRVSSEHHHLVTVPESAGISRRRT